MRPGDVFEARKNEIKKRIAEALVIIDKLIIRENMAGFCTSIVELRVDVNEKLYIPHNEKQNIARLMTRAFISHAAFFSEAL